MRRGLAAALLALMVACGSSQAGTGTSGADIGRLDADTVPTRIGALEVTAEESGGAVEGLGATYVAANALYSLREGDLVQATLQVTELDDDARFQTDDFRERIVSRIGSSRPEPVRIGDVTVYLTTGTKQTLALWFRDGFFFVLNIRDDFPRPRDLIRDALEVTP